MRLSQTLKAIVEDLESTSILTPAALAWALRHEVTIDDLSDWIRFDTENYVRNLITRTSRWELRVLCWRPGQSSAMHGHGGSACAYRVIRGTVTEVVLGARDRTWTPGAVVDESQGALVHQVGNSGPDALLTLHAYSPPLPVDAPSPRRGRSVVVVGGGFTGVALAYHLLKNGSSDLRITIVERGPWLGRGLAYGVDSIRFRLNVPASRMSLDPTVPDDFVRFAGAEASPHAFLPRNQYGNYVVQRLAEAIRQGGGKLRVVRGDAVAVGEREVKLADGRSLEAEVVTLATGIAPRLSPNWLAADPRIVDAWDECALATLPRDGRILVLGSGLTAVDVLVMLQARGHHGRVVVLSRRGLLPRTHLEPFTSGMSLDADVILRAPRTVRGLLHWGRQIVRDAAERGVPWQHAIDAIRVHVPTLWRSLPPAERARFVRKVRPYWDVLRHRAPSDSLAAIDADRASGKLDLRSGKVTSCDPTPTGLEVVLEDSRGRAHGERFDAIVRCIGPALELSDGEASLLADIIEKGFAARDPAGLGIVTDDQARVVAGTGVPSERIFALGATLRASAWETTSVPEIARHAHTLALRLLTQFR